MKEKKARKKVRKKYGETRRSTVTRRYTEYGILSHLFPEGRPPGVRIFFDVPSGGDYSGERLDVTELIVQWEESSEDREEKE